MDDAPIAGPPGISRDGFARVLEGAGSPAAPHAGDLYDALVGRGVDPLVFLAFFHHESGFGLKGVARDFDTRNPGNVRTPENPANGGEIVQTPRGPFARFPTWLAGTADWAERLTGPKYAGSGLHTVRQVVRKYAPPGDFDNDPDAYARSALAFIERHREDGMAQPQIRDLIDIRGQLARNPDADGPNESVPASLKDWTVVHYNGPAVDQGKEPIAYFQMIANYHAFVRNWGTAARPVAGDGIMYHLGIAPDGRVYWLRDFDAVLWHCGAAQNRTGFGIHCMLGGVQRASAAMLRSLHRVVDDLGAFGVPREHVVGHQELSPTTCPGTLMQDFVLPYRQGGHASTNALLDREYARCGGEAMLGAHVAKARMTWTVDWGAIDADVLICRRGVVSVSPAQTETAQAMFVDKATEALMALDVLAPYG